MSLDPHTHVSVRAGQGIIHGLPTASPDKDPIIQFQEWFDLAQDTNVYLPEAMTLATASSDGSPSARIVLLKHVDHRGFVFFTNYHSRKGDELKSNPRAALVVHWSTLQRQIRIEGNVEQISKDENETYFQSRPRGSRIGAWASRQSMPLSERSELDMRLEQFNKKYPGKDIPCPPHWGGFRVIPEKIEFWQGRKDRLHERLIFNRLPSKDWQTKLLYP
ncbi:MAG: pyridoxamine 5'-phosphate oxidase [Bacteroidetes bacterium]|nr:pyridoxamine 5'-phosphate oxidase [Bacteroidota bacterium]